MSTAKWNSVVARVPPDHGMVMPGLKELQAGARQITVRYDSLPNRAQIRYATTDAALKHALHSWFEAQRSDHGRHAMP